MTLSSSFNLIDEPWIRARVQTGSVEQFSLRELLRRAPDIRCLAGEIPTQDVAILRIGMAILLGATRPDRERSNDEVLDLWEHWWELGALPMAVIDRYLEAVRPRFNLLDDVVPFLQVAGLTTASGKHSGLAKVIADFPDGYHFFTTRGGAEISSLSLNEAARWIVHCQAFDPSGIKTGAWGDPRATGGRGYPFGYPAWAGNLGLVLAEGKNLFETLMLNTPWRKSGPNDIPVWERPPLGPGAEEPQHLPQGPADLFTWPSRRLRLFVDDGRVTDIQISNGDKLTPQDRFVHESMSAWRHSENQSKGGVKVYMPVLHDPSRRIWQGLGPLLTDAPADRTNVRAFVIEWLAQLRVEHLLPPDYLVNLHIVGLRYGTQNSVITGATDDRLAAPIAAMADPVLVRVSVNAAQHASKGVAALASLAGNLDRAAGGGRDAPDHTFEFGYSLLDRPYREWVRTLTNPEDAPRYEYEWDRIAFQVLLQAGGVLLTSAGAPAILGREVSRTNGETVLLDAGLAEIWFRAALSRAFPFKNDEVKS